MEKQQRRSSSADTSNGTNFSDDLLEEIFYRLPVKSLFRFKCVSTAWCNLICSDSFQDRLKLTMFGVFYKIHVNNRPSNFNWTEYKYACISGGQSLNGGVTDMGLSFLPCNLNFLIIDSCSGLLLCHVKSSKEVLYYVCNPVTKEWDALPRPTIVTFFERAKLAFDPSISPCYKVILSSGWLSNTEYTFEIFSSDSGKWVVYKVIPNPGSAPSLKPGVSFLDGTLYVTTYSHHLASINLTDGSFQMTKLPGEKSYNYFLLGHRGCLYYTSLGSSSLEVWMLKDYHTNEWILKYKINSQDLQEKVLESIFPSSMCINQPEFYILAFVPDFEVALFQANCILYSYHLSSSRLEEIDNVACKRGWTRYRKNGLLFHKKHFSPFLLTPCLNSLATTHSNAH